MNILFFIIPKSDVAYIYDDYSLRQTIEKMEYHKYTAVPLLNRQGIYIGTITEGDLLRTVKEQYDMNLHDAEDMPIYKVKRRWKIDPVTIDCDIEDLISLAMRQNFVPVVDDKGVFIGIIPRKAIIQYFYEKSGLSSKKCSPSSGM